MVDNSKRPVTDRDIVVIVAGCVAVVVAVAGVFFSTVFWSFREGGRVDLTVINRAASAVNVALVESSGHKTLLDVSRVAPGSTAKTSEHTGMVGAYVLRVQVGEKTYEEPQGGPLLDDDGPHRFRIEARDDGVTVTRQSNEGPYTYELEPASGHRAGQGR